MGQFSVKISATPGSVLSGNQHWRSNKLNSIATAALPMMIIHRSPDNHTNFKIRTLEHFPIRLTDILLWRRNFYIRLG